MVVGGATQTTKSIDMKQVILKSANGQYFLEGRGFVASQKDATRLNPDQVECKVKCAASFGVSAYAEEVNNVSFGVVYIRAKDVTPQGTLNKQRPVGPEIDPSKRRFATIEEARTHGNRYPMRRKNRGDAPGTAGHRGYYTVETNDPVNAAVNPETNLTNSL